MSDEVKKHLVISVAHDGYRRAGMAFNKGDNLIEADQITEAQLAQIQADPRLKYELPQEGHQGDASSGAMDRNEHGMSLIDAIKTLDRNNEDHFTNGGKPELKALSSVLGRKVAAAERDEAWDALQESANSQGVE